MRDLTISGGYLKRFGAGIVLSVLVLLMVSTGWAAPTVTDIQPPDGSTQPISTTVTATFSEAMDPVTITNGSFTVSRFVATKDIAAGWSHTVALREDGIVAAWGDNTYSQTLVPAGLSGVIDVAAGGYHSVALKDDGTVVAWGRNDYGQCTVPVGLSGVTAIAAGAFHTVALKGDGTVIAWGFSAYGQTTVPAGLSGVTAIAAGDYHTVALKNDGTVDAWGFNDYGQITVPDGLAGVTAIAAGSLHTVALVNDGTVIAWGFNYFGQTTVPTDLSEITTIAAGGTQTVALKDDGTVVAWGNNNFGQTTVPVGLTGIVAIAMGNAHTAALKDDGTVITWGLEATIPPGLSGAIAIAAGEQHTLALKNDGTVLAWGNNNYGQGSVWSGLSGVTAIAAGYSHSVALKNDGTVYAWGFNYFGQRTVPAGLAGVTAIAAGAHHTVALKNDGTVVAWGWDGYGQATVPAGLSEVIAIAARDRYSMALKGDGTVVAWGNNSYGQCTVPVGLSGVTAIAAGYYHSVALKEDGTVVAWGLNNVGQTTVPEGLSGVTAIAAGPAHTMAVKEDGTVVAWGDVRYPVPANLSGVVATAMGQGHFLALKNDGTVVAWGNNDYGKATVPTYPLGTPVAGTVEYDQVADTATFTPLAPLEPAATYFAIVNTGVRNIDGAHLAADVRWNFVTEKASATVSLDGLSQIYDGSIKAVTATTEPAGLAVDITYNGSATAPTAVGSYSIVATINDSYYQGNATGTLVIAPVTPITSATLVSQPSSKVVPIGTKITFTAAALGGTGSPLYQFKLMSPGQTARVEVQAWSQNEKWEWDTAGLPVGEYTIWVYAKNAGSSANYEATKGMKVTVVTDSPVTSVNLVPLPNKVAYLTGQVINFTSSASGGTGSYEYKFQLLTGGTTTVLQNYSTINTMSWDMQGLLPGNYTIQVLARNVNSVATSEANKSIVFTMVTEAPVSSVTLTADPIITTFPAGQVLSFLAAASGGSGTYEHQFRVVHDGVVKEVLQGYSPSNSCVWNTQGLEPGSYILQVLTRNVGSLATWEAQKNRYYTIQ